MLAIIQLACGKVRPGRIFLYLSGGDYYHPLVTFSVLFFLEPRMYRGWCVLGV